MPVSRKHSFFNSTRGFIVGALLFGLLTTGLSAELIQLKNGDYIQGRIVSQDQQRVVMKTDAGQRVILKSRIRRIVYDKGMEARLIAAKKAEEEAQREAERRKREEELRRQKEAELAALEEERQRKEAEERRLREERERIANERRARAARARYAYVVAEYNRRKAAYEQQLAEEERRKKEQEKEVVQKEEDATKTEVDRWGPFWRSMLIPGWGQMYAGQTGIGVAFTGAFALTAYNSYAARGIAVGAGNEYTSFTDTTFLTPLLPGAGAPVAAYVYFETDRLARTYENRVAGYTQSLYFLGGVYIVQLLHAALLSKEITTASLLEDTGDENGGFELIMDQPRTLTPLYSSALPNSAGFSTPSAFVEEELRTTPADRIGVRYSIHF